MYCIDIFCIFTNHKIAELSIYSPQEGIKYIIPTSNLLLWLENRPRPRGGGGCCGTTTWRTYPQCRAGGLSAVGLSVGSTVSLTHCADVRSTPGLQETSDRSLDNTNLNLPPTPRGRQSLLWLVFETNGQFKLCKFRLAETSKAKRSLIHRLRFLSSQGRFLGQGWSFWEFSFAEHCSQSYSTFIPVRAHIRVDHLLNPISVPRFFL